MELGLSKTRTKVFLSLALHLAFGMHSANRPLGLPHGCMVLKPLWASRWSEELVKLPDSPSPSPTPVTQLGWSMAQDLNFNPRVHLGNPVPGAIFAKGEAEFKGNDKSEIRTTVKRVTSLANGAFPSLFSLPSLQENDYSFSSTSSRVLGVAVSRKESLAISCQSLNKTVFKK